MTKVVVKSVQLSSAKGVAKTPVPKIVLNDMGVEGDAHAGNWHRQVSLLAVESIARFQEKLGREIACGEFAENITTQGLELFKCMPLDRFTCGEVVLEVTQIGKKCHGDNCAIFQQVGSCVMPKEGIFCRVLSGGVLQAGNELFYSPYGFKAKVITLSDRASRGEYNDVSGPLLVQRIERFWKVNGRTGTVHYECLPDDASLLQKTVTSAIAQGFDYLFTTGGTGIGPRDITVPTVRPLLQKELPGVMEFIRMKYGSQKPQVLLGGGVAGVAGRTLVFTLPGSPNGVREYMDELEKLLEHAFFMVNGVDVH